MKVKKIFEVFLLIGLFMFAIAGASVLSIVLHEYSHYNDFKGYTNSNELCGLTLPTSINGLWDGAAGYYGYSYNASDSLKVAEIGRNTEIKAYAISTFIFIMLFLCMKTAIKYIILVTPVKEDGD